VGEDAEGSHPTSFINAKTISELAEYGYLKVTKFREPSEVFPLFVTLIFLEYTYTYIYIYIYIGMRMEVCKFFDVNTIIIIIIGLNYITGNYMHACAHCKVLIISRK
jgi:hypothetical protein